MQIEMSLGERLGVKLSCAQNNSNVKKFYTKSGNLCQRFFFSTEINDLKYSKTFVNNFTTEAQWSDVIRFKTAQYWLDVQFSVGPFGHHQFMNKWELYFKKNNNYLLLLWSINLHVNLVSCSGHKDWPDIFF